MEEVVIVGAGPCGLSAALALQQIGIDPLVIEKNVVVSSIYQYPTYLEFFSTPEMLEIAGIPFTTPNEKPNRLEALHYYRNVAMRRNVRINSYETVTSIDRLQGGGFRIEAADRFGEQHVYDAKHVVVATGYFDHPNMLGIPGEDLPHVSHFFREAHPYTGMNVAIIGGNNSAVDAALELQRVGAKVTIVYRGETYSSSIKPWVRPTFEGLVTKGKISMRFGSRIRRIAERYVEIESQDGILRENADFVLVLTGFRPERTFLANSGVIIKGEYGIPEYDPDTMETNVEGLYIAGVIAAGSNANEIFIESGRHHGEYIARHLISKRENDQKAASE